MGRRLVRRQNHVRPRRRVRPACALPRRHKHRLRPRWPPRPHHRPVWHKRPSRTRYLRTPPQSRHRPPVDLMTRFRNEQRSFRGTLFVCLCKGFSKSRRHFQFSVFSSQFCTIPKNRGFARSHKLHEEEALCSWWLCERITPEIWDDTQSSVDSVLILNKITMKNGKREIQNVQ